MKFYTYILSITLFVISCDSPKSELNIYGKWNLNTQRMKLEGIKVTIPVQLVQENMDCYSFIDFMSESQLIIGDCKPDYSRSYSDSLFIQSESTFTYLFKDSILEFDNRRFKLSFLNANDLILNELIENDTITFKYKRL